MKVPLALERYRAEIDVELKGVLDGRHSPMYDMMRYHLGWADEKGRLLDSSAGKALRPTLCLLACEAVGGTYTKALPAAAAIELVHNFSLIHDDIQDNDRERRHRPTVWSVWGKPQAINAGTAMRVAASLALARLGECGVPAQKQLQAQRLMDESCLEMIEGQYLDLSYESRLDVGVTEYLEMIERKTAALIACSLELGALLGSDDRRVADGFRSFGRNLGMAFQIRDDVLGIWGDEKKTGKPRGSDIRRKKKSLPVVYALEKAQGRAKAELTGIYQDGAIDDNSLDKVLGILDDVQAEAQAQSLAEMYSRRALAEIEKVALLPGAHHSLVEMTHFLVERGF